MEISSEQEHCYESETDDTYDSDDSQEDPSFDVVEETRFSFSNISIKRDIKKTCSDKGTNDKTEKDSVDEQDQKSYETILKIIQGGQLEKLKVDQCKIYLRKHGLRLSGNKETLIQRIKEHSDIVNGDGEKKYPASSFVLNCKGDACTGDVVIFEQNVYEMFNIASRSANGPPCGTRVVAGRIVKESYGAAKQQHTFTIEVLWSKGEKPLPPLHPLLIKGRNLYRLKTMRQKWQDEGERYKILSEKHARGGVARLTREERIQHKEMRKSQKPSNRTTRNGRQQRHKEEEKGKTSNCYISKNQPENLNIVHAPRVPLERLHQGQPLINMNHNIAINPVLGFGYNHNMPGHFFLNPNVARYSHQSHSSYNEHEKNAVQKKGHEQRQICRFYPQGRCHFGDRCKYLHELAGNK